MKSAQELREELAHLTRYANQLAADLADTRGRIRMLVAALGLPKISLFRAHPLHRTGELRFGPVFAVNETQPEPWKSVRLHLSDGTTPLGVWTGFEWWSQGRVQHPTNWQPVLADLPPTEAQHSASA